MRESMTGPQDGTLSILRNLASRPGHDEVKSGFREVVALEFGVDRAQIKLEERVQEIRGRLDALVGLTVFEAKRDLKKEWRDIERRMPEYLADRERDEEEACIGIASDGLDWVVLRLEDTGDLVGHEKTLREVRRIRLDPENGAENFLAWLEGSMAIQARLPPEPLTVIAELGQDSTAFDVVRKRMSHLWENLKDQPDVALKRSLWANLLEKVHGQVVDDDDLWVQHTYLVLVAKCIAYAVMGLDTDDPKELLSGKVFADRGIDGAVESDFFDWILSEQPSGVNRADQEGRHQDSPGYDLIRRIMNHVRRFRLQDVQSDILRVLYESLIDRQARHGLGEYYTPDWLAAKVVRHSVKRPIEQRVLDPACGSGAFLFHGLRRFLAAAEDEGVPREIRAQEACDHVAGMDIHPVAVIIARVTYLLALSPTLTGRRDLISIPVYLGDAMQLSVLAVLADKELRIDVPPLPPAPVAKGNNASSNMEAASRQISIQDEDRKNGREVLDFPDVYCRDAALFDKVIECMRAGPAGGMKRQQIEAAIDRITQQHYRADITDEQQRGITQLGVTYETFARLCEEGRDTIWAYVARNLSRPLALSARGGWANVLVGNPPWVSFRYMTPELQAEFRKLSREEGIYIGGEFATQSDLSSLFAVRSARFYLRPGGQIGLLLPLATLTRGQYKKFRTGHYVSTRVTWEESWCMNSDLQPLFPVPSCAVFGRKRGKAEPLPLPSRTFFGDLPLRDAPEELADKLLTETGEPPDLAVGIFSGGSPYRKRFKQGATLVPRVTVFVERVPVGPLGMNPQRPLVRSRRSNLEKVPWKDLPSIEENVEAAFVKPILLGESILPYRVFRPLEGVIPMTDEGTLLDSQAAADLGYAGLPNWLRKAETCWKELKKGNLSLTKQLDYYGKLSAQIPANRFRVVYARSGTLPCACITRNRETLVDFSLYWSAFAEETECHYLAALFNSETTRSRIAGYQSLGQWGRRDIAKVMFNLPIPPFDPKDSLHQGLARAGQEAEVLAGQVELDEGLAFQTARKRIRLALVENGISARMDSLVAQLLDRY